ncbi:MAG TPA: phosphodiester glycosidase family protein [Candidatus Obscuribacterales bacterium]
MQRSLLDLDSMNAKIFRASKGSFLAGVMSLVCCQSALSIGIVIPSPVKSLRTSGLHRVVKTHSKSTGKSFTTRSTARGSKKGKSSSRWQAKKGNARAKKAAKARPAKAIPPQTLTGKLNVHTLAPGVVHKFYRGALTINVLDVDLVNAPVKVRPVLAGDDFRHLKDVTDHAKESRAIAAVNANYFKFNGTPLGTLIIDGEWVAGPLFDRVSMGITRNGFVRIERVNLYGTLTTSNPEIPTIWVNNINQPRRTGSRLIAYTRRWGSYVRLPYEGCLVAVNAQGEVVDTDTATMGIPWGGYVLSDSKKGAISKLRRGDVVDIDWKTRPAVWEDVVSAVSGGPMLIKDGKLYLDLKEERFSKRWTGSHITARTAAGVTASNHLLLVTVEGPHTLWDMAKFLRDLGAVDALNLDGGGSTTMVVNGQAVTRGAKTHQRRVASSIAILDERIAGLAERPYNGSYSPRHDLYGFLVPSNSFAPRQSAEVGGAKAILGSLDNFVVPVVVPGNLGVDSTANKTSAWKNEDTPPAVESDDGRLPNATDAGLSPQPFPSELAQPTPVQAENAKETPRPVGHRTSREHGVEADTKSEGWKKLIKNPFRNPLALFKKRS